jgi:transcriptional regulator with XRE-family HTH domain
MINRIRAIRKEKGMTLADVAEACDPPTTPQTIGRLETGMRNLSITWMQKIADALGVPAETLVRSEDILVPQVLARLTEAGAEPLARTRDAILPSELAEDAPMVCLAIESPAGEYRAGDQVWMQQVDADEAPALINRDVLAPRPGGRFAFGRLIDRSGNLVGILPPGIGQKQIVVDKPAWLAVATMLVRKL